MRSRRRIDRSSIIAHRLNFDIQRERSLKCDAKTWHICIYHPLYNLYGFSLSIGNTNVATLTCLGWLLKYFNYSCPQADVTRMRTSYLIDGSFKFEVDPHQFNLRLQHFSQFQRKKIKSWQVCDWLAKWLIALRFLHLNLVRSQCLQNYWGHFLRYHQIERTFRYRHGLLNWANFSNLIVRISHIWFQFCRGVIRLWLSTDNGRHCERFICQVTLPSLQHHPKDRKCCFLSATIVCRSMRLIDGIRFYISITPAIAKSALCDI